MSARLKVEPASPTSDAVANVSCRTVPLVLKKSGFLWVGRQDNGVTSTTSQLFTGADVLRSENQIARALLLAGSVTVCRQFQTWLSCFSVRSVVHE